jgi:hypothetical protein
MAVLNVSTAAARLVRPNFLELFFIGTPSLMNIINRRVDPDCLSGDLSNTRSCAGTVTFKGVPGVPVALPAASQPREKFVRASNF